MKLKKNDLEDQRMHLPKQFKLKSYHSLGDNRAFLCHDVLFMAFHEIYLAVPISSSVDIQQIKVSNSTNSRE